MQAVVERKVIQYKGHKIMTYSVGKGTDSLLLISGVRFANIGNTLIHQHG